MDPGDMTVLHTALSSASVGGTELWFSPEEEDEGPGTSASGSCPSLVRSSSLGSLWVSISSFSLALHLSCSLVPA